MKQIYMLTLVLFIYVGKVHSQNLIDFNSTSDLTTYFNPSTGATITNGNSNGISNSGAADIGSTTEIWTLKTGYPLSLNANYIVSAYCKISGNSGRGGIGFTINNTNMSSLYGHPSNTLGMGFHGGGGELINNSATSAVSWPPDLVIGNWYFMELTITYTSANTFDIDFNIYNSDSDGNLGTLKTNQSFTGETNAILGAATTLYPYFCHDGSRLSQIDNFSGVTENNTLGIDDFNAASNKISISPNPSSDFIQVTGISNSQNYKIHTLLGSEIKQHGIVSDNGKIDIKNLSKGLYLLKLDNGNTLKFLKE